MDANYINYTHILLISLIFVVALALALVGWTLRILLHDRAISHGREAQLLDRLMARSLQEYAVHKAALDSTPSDHLNRIRAENELVTAMEGDDNRIPIS